MLLTMFGFAMYLLPISLTLASYIGYPLLLLALRRRRVPVPTTDPPEWPPITIVIPVFNEARVIAATLDNVLEADYPSERRHVLVVSDASTDGTDEIVRGFADRNVELVRLAKRGGKTAAENVAANHLRGAIVINLDATTRISPSSLKALVRTLEDPSVGVASGRDISVGDEAVEQNFDESRYVDYEMWVRRLETESGSIVGASGCFFAIRRELFSHIFPEALSRDFASSLIAHEYGFRSVSVDSALCFVRRARSHKAEFRRKVRTMTRGLETLWYKRHLLNPYRHGRFAVFLIGHKLLRWMVFLSIPPAVVGLLIVGFESVEGAMLFAANLFIVGLGVLGYFWPAERRVPPLLSLMGFVVSAHLAGLLAWYRALRGELDPIWEPTRR